jgi:Tfp pilus assembly protein FimT
MNRGFTTKRVSQKGNSDFSFANERREKNRSSGFTLLEILIVIAMSMLVGGFALFVSMETFRGSTFHSDRNLLVATLQRARAQAVNNVCIGVCTDGKPHGVHIQSDTYVLFQGSSYSASDPLNAVFESSVTTIKTPATLDIVFSQLSGATSAATVTLSDAAGRSSVITINAEGQITWTN